VIRRQYRRIRKKVIEQAGLVAKKPWGHWKRVASTLEVGRPMEVQSRVEYLAIYYAAKGLGFKIALRRGKVYRIE